jgi:hypothetical protein
VEEEREALGAYVRKLQDLLCRELGREWAAELCLTPGRERSKRLSPRRLGQRLALRHEHLPEGVEELQRAVSAPKRHGHRSSPSLLLRRCALLFRL